MGKIELNNVYKRYPNATSDSVKDFNLVIEDGEFIVLVGPSGCGKSTTLRMIAGLEEITSGEFMINGNVMNNVESKDRGIAMVFQNYALYPHMNVYKNIEFGLKLKKYDKAERERRITEATEILELTEYLDRKPGALSGGQRQRVALGRAIVRDADVFLMDEPLSNLDAKLRVHMRTQITELHRRLGSVTIYVTHDQTEAMTMADRIVVMDKGVIQQIGNPDEVYHNPVNVFVASFMGSPGMNIMTAEVKDTHIVIDEKYIFELPRETADSLNKQGYNNQSILFGIRPEEIHIDSEYINAHPNWTFKSKVDIGELDSNETIIYSTIGSNDFIARLDYMNVLEPDTEISFGFDMSKAYFFKPSEERIYV